MFFLPVMGLCCVLYASTFVPIRFDVLSRPGALDTFDRVHTIDARTFDGIERVAIGIFGVDSEIAALDRKCGGSTLSGGEPTSAKLP